MSLCLSETDLYDCMCVCACVGGCVRVSDWWTNALRRRRRRQRSEMPQHRPMRAYKDRAISAKLPSTQILLGFSDME
jgi:hypothetical protein